MRGRSGGGGGGGASVLCLVEDLSSEFILLIYF